MRTQDDHATLRRLLDQERAAHIRRDAPMLVALFADDFINVAAGRITRPTRTESLAGFQAYFDRSEFLAWDDIEPPLLRISSDGSMAYVIVRKRVHLISTAADGRREEQETIFAWMEAWERLSTEWALKAVASTNEPD
jgi:ketosteroid isomerase-like protein